MNAFNHFFEEFKSETSILTDTFFGFNETTNIYIYNILYKKHMIY